MGEVPCDVCDINFKQVTRVSGLEHRAVLD